MGFHSPDGPGMRLYTPTAGRLYINSAERTRFLTAARAAHPIVRSLALTLTFTGCRLSEALALSGDNIQPTAQLVTFQTLKRRSSHHFREVPVPPELIAVWRRTHDTASNAPLFARQGQSVHRATAYRWIKGLMERADVYGAQACPKGLRHGFGVHAVLSGVPLNVTQRWMGHANMSTTAIYTNVSGPEERRLAAQMWQ